MCVCVISYVPKDADFPPSDEDVRDRGRRSEPSDRWALLIFCLAAPSDPNARARSGKFKRVLSQFVLLGPLFFFFSTLPGSCFVERRYLRAE